MVQCKKRAMMTTSLSRQIPYAALMSLLSVALSSATAKSNYMILNDSININIQRARSFCSITAISVLDSRGFHALFKRFGCSSWTAYIMIPRNETRKQK